MKILPFRFFVWCVMLELLFFTNDYFQLKK